jgi:hypothetical protein
MIGSFQGLLVARHSEIPGSSSMNISVHGTKGVNVTSPKSSQ